jgi:hypothetical protein
MQLPKCVVQLADKGINAVLIPMRKADQDTRSDGDSPAFIHCIREYMLSAVILLSVINSYDDWSCSSLYYSCSPLLTRCNLTQCSCVVSGAKCPGFVARGFARKHRFICCCSLFFSLLLCFGVG